VPIGTTSLRMSRNVLTSGLEKLVPLLFNAFLFGSECGGEYGMWVFELR